MSTIDFGSLYDRYARDVLHFALYLTGDRREADDIVAETFVRAWLATGEIRMASIKGYLLSIARHLHIERYRQRARTTTLTDGLPDPSIDPERAAGSRDELQAVMR